VTMNMFVSTINISMMPDSMTESHCSNPATIDRTR
jgi:hypothetical protein